MRKVKLAMVQFDSLLKNVAVNVQRAIHFVREASVQKADIIVFPELCTSGYNMAIIGNEYHKLGELITDSTVEKFCDAAKAYNINVVIPMPLKKMEDFYNSAVLIDRRGYVVGDYGKTHLWTDEKNFFKAANDYPVYDMDFGKVGVMICYDAGFPEVSRMLALQGAELIVAPSAFTMIHKQRWDIYFQARALENSCFVAGINGVGGQGEVLFGNNKLFNPQGEKILEGRLNQEEMQVVKIDLAEVAKCRTDTSYLSELRIDTYWGYKD
jgi:predicted amidohydrolase